MDAPCERSSECFVTSEPDTVECRNSQCKCKVDNTADVEAQACIKPRPVKKSKFLYAFTMSCQVSCNQLYVSEVNLLLLETIICDADFLYTIGSKQNKLCVFVKLLNEKNLMLTKHAKIVVMNFLSLLR